MDDCFYCCVMEDPFSTSDNPLCRTTGVLNCANGTGVCHREGIDAVRGFSVGNTDPLRFSIRVQATRGGFSQQLSVKVLDNQPLYYGPFHEI